MHVYQPTQSTTTTPQLALDHGSMEQSIKLAHTSLAIICLTKMFLVQDVMLLLDQRHL